jgi:hypothetical protein
MSRYRCVCLDMTPPSQPCAACLRFPTVFRLGLEWLQPMGALPEAARERAGERWTGTRTAADWRVQANPDIAKTACRGLEGNFIRSDRRLEVETNNNNNNNNRRTADDKCTVLTVYCPLRTHSQRKSQSRIRRATCSFSTRHVTPIRAPVASFSEPRRPIHAEHMLPRIPSHIPPGHHWLNHHQIFADHAGNATISTSSMPVRL